MMGGYGGGMWFGWIWPVILIIGLAALVWGLMRARSSSRDSSWPADRPSGGEPPREDSAREILRERYARGEISEEEMQERMRALDGR